MGVLEKLQQFAIKPIVAVPILIANAIGMAFGWYYYYDVGQFRPSSTYFEPYYLWPLVSDSPNALLLFVIAHLILWVSGRSNKWLDAFAIILNFYVGAWTTLLFNLFPDTLGTYDWGSTNSILYVTHMAMPLQALILVHSARKSSWKIWEIAVIAASLAIYLFVDYGVLHAHPAPFVHDSNGGGDGALHFGSIGLMIAAFIAWILLVPTRGPISEQNA